MDMTNDTPFCLVKVQPKPFFLRGTEENETSVTTAGLHNDNYWASRLCVGDWCYYCCRNEDNGGDNTITTISFDTSRRKHGIIP